MPVSGDDCSDGEAVVLTDALDCVALDEGEVPRSTTRSRLLRPWVSDRLRRFTQRDREWSIAVVSMTTAPRPLARERDSPACPRNQGKSTPGADPSASSGPLECATTSVALGRMQPGADNQDVTSGHLRLSGFRAVCVSVASVLAEPPINGGVE